MNDIRELFRSNSKISLSQTIVTHFDVLNLITQFYFFFSDNDDESPLTVRSCSMDDSESQGGNKQDENYSKTQKLRITRNSDQPG